MKFLSLAIVAYIILVSNGASALTSASASASLWDTVMSILSTIGIVSKPLPHNIVQSQPPESKTADFQPQSVQYHEEEKDSNAVIGPLLEDAKKLIQTGTMDQSVVGILLNALEIDPDHHEAVPFNRSPDQCFAVINYLFVKRIILQELRSSPSGGPQKLKYSCKIL